MWSREILPSKSAPWVANSVNRSGRCQVSFSRKQMSERGLLGKHSKREKQIQADEGAGRRKTEKEEPQAPGQWWTVARMVVPRVRPSIKDVLRPIRASWHWCTEDAMPPTAWLWDKPRGGFRGSQLGLTSSASCNRRPGRPGLMPAVQTVPFPLICMPQLWKKSALLWSCVVQNLKSLRNLTPPAYFQMLRV